VTGEQEIARGIMQPQYQQPADQQQVAKPGPSLVISLIVLFVGIAVLIPSVWAGFAPIVRGFTKSPVLTPVNTTMHFSHGKYLVYVRTDDLFGETITPGDVHVFGPDGRIATGIPSNNENITRGGSKYVGTVEFDIPSKGDYTVQINTTNPHEVIITRSIFDSVQAALGWFAAMGLGAILVITGIVLIIVGSVRRGRAQRMQYAYNASYGRGYGGTYGGGYGAPTAATAPPTTPPGWYPDPDNTPGRQRWWDGTRWTEHTHP
jgi:hypothetical protein